MFSLPTDRPYGNYNLRRLRSWVRSPGFYFRRARRKLFGDDLSFLALNRNQFLRGSCEWLAITEQLYGGFQTSAAVDALALKKVPQDRAPQLCLGGDRMSPIRHDYGATYAEFLKRFLPGNAPLILVEIGILNGSGLAIWCDLFPQARIIGLDIDLRNFECNRENLLARGAFQRNQPEVHQFDQLDPAAGASVLKRVLGDQKADIVIDDGCHSLESIQITFDVVRPYLNRRFTYFIEDNYDTYEELAFRRADFSWYCRGELTVACEKD